MQDRVSTIKSSHEMVSLLETTTGGRLTLKQPFGRVFVFKLYRGPFTLQTDGSEGFSIC